MKEKENVEFFRQMVRLRAEFSRYFSAGEMARPPKLFGSIPTVRADWQWSGQWWVTNNAVLTGAWQLPKERRMVLFFVNVSDESVPTQAQFKAEASAIRAHVLHAQCRKVGGSRTAREDWPAASERSLTFSPRQAEAWELRW